MAENIEKDENLEPNENPETTGSHYIEDESAGLDPGLKKGLGVAIGVIVVVLLAIIGYQYIQNSKAEQRVDVSSRLIRVQQLMSEGNTDAALMGSQEVTRGGEPIMGYKEIAEKYSDVEGGKTAALNAGKIFLDRGDLDNALKMFDIAEDSDAVLTMMGAMAGKASIMEEKGNYTEAADLYLKVSKLSLATGLKQKYTYFAGLNHAEAGNNDKASDLLNQSIKLSPGAQWANMARAELGRLGMEIEY